jgi:hypothetical protein
MRVLLTDILTTVQAAELAGISSQTIIDAIRRGQFVPDVDCIKRGHVWLVTRQAVERVFDRQFWNADEGHIFCNRCDRHLPHTEDHFHPYTSRHGKPGLRRTCRDCVNSLQASWRDNNRPKLRDYWREQAARFRASNPGYDARWHRARRERRRTQEGKTA